MVSREKSSDMTESSRAGPVETGTNYDEKRSCGLRNSMFSKPQTFVAPEGRDNPINGSSHVVNTWHVGNFQYLN